MIQNRHSFMPQAGLHILRDGLPARSPLRRGVIVLGNFDGFHRGHLFLIRHARRIAADGRPLGIMSVEPHPRQVFTPQAAPFRLASLRQKHQVAQSVGLDFIYEPVFDSAFSSQTPHAFIEEVLHRKLAVSHVIIGADFRFGAKRAGNSELLARECLARGIGLTVLPLQSDFSSTSVRQALRDGDMVRARKILGRPWQAEVSADQGQISLAAGQIRPCAGEYLVRGAGLAGSARITLEASGRLLYPHALPEYLSFLERVG